MSNLSEGILKQFCGCPKFYSKAQTWHKVCSFLDSLSYFTAVYGQTCNTKYWVKLVFILYKYMYIPLHCRILKISFFFQIPHFLNKWWWHYPLRKRNSFYLWRKDWKTSPKAHDCMVSVIGYSQLTNCHSKSAGKECLGPTKPQPMNMLLKRSNNTFWKWFVPKEVGRDLGYLTVILAYS